VGFKSRRPDPGQGLLRSSLRPNTEANASARPSRVSNARRAGRQSISQRESQLTSFRKALHHSPTRIHARMPGEALAGPLEELAAGRRIKAVAGGAARAGEPTKTGLGDSSDPIDPLIDRRCPGTGVRDRGSPVWTMRPLP
jgi:hypothetical protein